MIIVQICGGLGNQLFQYAYARALQEKGNNVRLASVFYTHYRTKREYLLDNFNIRIKRGYLAEKLLSPIADNDLSFQIRNRFIREELSPGYKPELLDIRGTCYMIGVFQSEKYFKNLEEKLRTEIYPKKKIVISRELKKILSSKNTVSIHIRRGDYKQLNNVLGMKYYSDAVDFIKKRVRDPLFLVFSDDMQWVKEHLHLAGHIIFVNSDRKLQDFEELMVMSKCRHQIIANSTFSWWGAWLNTNPDKIVVGPKNWSRSPHSNIMPEDWIRI